ncbi:metallophosphoesterase family protein [Halorarum halophilum]|uniref:Metallophosphoesterase family protein n=1 Tax=Halorarum halophilum TaxID=2743090 RepID=A0A7D5GDT3_9EURY|nr:metallophosphoesterase [Halobaculum halophilum]QLG29286.1 metallophosphoesterase family protein [Halobaculum halophilum]
MPTFRFRDRAVHLPEADALVCADLHVGRAEASDVEYPLGEGADLEGRLRALLAEWSPTEVVFAGDVLHEFGRVSLASDRSLAGLADVCRDEGATPVVVAGNHDTLLSEVWDGTIHDAYALDAGGERVVVRHGHEAPPRDEDADCYVVGHDHPTIDIEGQRRPCFLYGPGQFRGTDVLMLPSFTRLAAGVTVNGMGTRDFDSPFVTDANALRPVVRDDDADETLEFPPLGEFRRLL